MSDGMAQLRAGGQVYEIDIPVNDPESDAAARINDAFNRGALSGGCSVILPPGTYWCRQTIRIHSDSELSLSAGALLRLAPGANCDMIANSDPVGGNSRISISGAGVIDGNRAAQTGDSNGIHLMACDDARIEATIRNCYTDGLALLGCKRPLLNIASSSNGRHGVYLAGCSSPVGNIIAINNGQMVAASGLALDGIAGLGTTDSSLFLAATDTQTGKTQQFGVIELISSGCYRNTIVGSCAGNALGSASLDGSTSILVGGIVGGPTFLDGGSATSVPTATYDGGAALAVATNRFDGGHAAG